MYKELIKNWISNLKKETIIEYAKKTNIILTDSEVNILYQFIMKKRYNCLVRAKPFPGAVAPAQVQGDRNCLKWLILFRSAASRKNALFGRAACSAGLFGESSRKWRP